MSNNFTNEDIAKAVAHKFQGGQVDTITASGDVVVKIGNTFTRIAANQVKQAVMQSRQAPKEDLMQVAKDRIQRDNAVDTAMKADSQRKRQEDMQRKRERGFADGYEV